MSGLLLDATIAAFLLCLGWGAMHARSTSAAIGLFVCFGLVLSLAWARLGAPDLALAEAAIGAGLTGVLLLQAAAASREPEIITTERPGWPAMLLVVLAFLMLTATVLGGGASIVQEPGPLPGLVSDNLADSGVSHPVTAVLLNFRAWDTLLELLVLVLALLGFKQLYIRDLPFSKRSILGDHPEAWPLLRAWTRILAPLLVLVGGYLLWRGAADPGGAFQAGALLAAAIVMLRLSHLLPPLRWSWWPVRTLVVGGALLFLAVAAYGLANSGNWLSYPEGNAGLVIVVVEVFATLSIAMTLGLLVAGEREDLAE
jgi:multisubunit Na+/H+ antiporter MnhB subunit